MKKFADLVFVVIILLVLVTFPYGAVAGPKTISEQESRALTTEAKFSLTAFKDSTYQTELEDYLADQFIASGTLKGTYNEIINDTLYRLSDPYYKHKIQTGTTNGSNTAGTVNESGSVDTANKDRGAYRPTYRPANGDLYTLYGSSAEDYYLYKPDGFVSTLNGRLPESTRSEAAAFYNHINNIAPQGETVSNYLYFVEGDTCVDFTREVNDHAFYEHIRLFLGNYTTGYFGVENYEDYTENYWKTDHHWNDKGAYRGYKEILQLMDIQDDPLTPAGEIDDDIAFLGSKAKVVGSTKFHDDFTPYYFNFPEYKTYINGDAASIGEESLYLAGSGDDYTALLKNEWTDHYQKYYGYTHKMVTIENPDSHSGENLLIVGFSYRYPLHKLLACHFDSVYSIDTRDYEADFGEPLQMQKFVDENHITRVLFLVDSYSFNKERDLAGFNAIQK